MIGAFQNTAGLLDFITREKPDVVFVDIELREKSGIDFAAELQNRIDNVSVVFVTAYPEYALEAFRAYPLDYIVKPVDEERLVRTIQHITKSAVFRSDCFDKDFHIVNNGLKTGYTFIGWNTKADGTGTDYVKDDILTFTEDVTLYALWSEDRIVTGTETDGVTSAPISALAALTLLYPKKKSRMS